MPRVKKQKPWEEVFRRFRSVYRSEWLYPPKPTDEDIDAVEVRLGIRFPASYLAFAREFGLGGDFGLVPTYHLTTCSESSPDWPGGTVLEETQCLKAYPEYIDDPAFVERLEFMVVFAADSGYETFAFDSAQVTDARWGEYRIYSVWRDGRVTATADSFDEWLRYIEEHFRFEPEGEEDEKDEPPFPIVMKPDSTVPSPMTYHRFIIRPKEGPEEEDVKLWLAWNNGCILGLARSIREEGHGETGLPVLADALEEAGCTNKDVLWSCRQGDPDIDGAWVLAVLLGKEKPSGMHQGQESN
jgi:hypothetical protein